MAEFDNAQPGDKVFLCTGGWSRHLQVCTIAKVGKLHITLEKCSTKYRRSSGRSAGDRWSSEYIKPYSEQEWQEYQDEVQARQMRYAVRDFDWQRADIELIRKVHELLPKTPEVR